MPTTDVVVVGAGLAGLTAARALGGRRPQRDGARGPRPRRWPDPQPRPRRRPGRRGRAGSSPDPRRTTSSRWPPSSASPPIPAYNEGAASTCAARTPSASPVTSRPTCWPCPTSPSRCCASTSCPVRSRSRRPGRRRRPAAWDAMTFESWLRRTTAGSGALDLVNVFLSSVYGASAADASRCSACTTSPAWATRTTSGPSTAASASRAARRSRGSSAARSSSRSRWREQLDGRVVLDAPVRSIDAGRRRRSRSSPTPTPGRPSRSSWRSRRRSPRASPGRRCCRRSRTRCSAGSPSAR